MQTASASAKKHHRAIEEPAVWGMSPTDIKVALLRRGISQRDIARKLGVTYVAVNRVVIGAGRSRRIEAVIKGIILGEVTV